MSLYKPGEAPERVQVGIFTKMRLKRREKAWNGCVILAAIYGHRVFHRAKIVTVTTNGRRKMSDLISRGKLFNLLAPVQTLGEAYGIIQGMPTVDAVPVRHGRWEMKSDPYGFFDEIPVCSECGCTTRLREVYKFCPNCGADMRKDGDHDRG